MRASTAGRVCWKLALVTSAMPQTYEGKIAHADSLKDVAGGGGAGPRMPVVV